MDRFFIVCILMLVSFSIVYPSLSYADINDNLREAIAVGNLESTKISIESGADVNSVYNDESTPLMDAVEKSNGSTDIISLLLKHGANPKFKRGGLSPLSVALRANNEAVVKLLGPFAADETESYGLFVLSDKKRKQFRS